MTGNPSHKQRIETALLDLAECNALTTVALAERTGISEGAARRWIASYRPHMIMPVGTEPTTTTGPDRVVWGMREVER